MERVCEAEDIDSFLQSAFKLCEQEQRGALFYFTIYFTTPVCVKPYFFLKVFERLKARLNKNDSYVHYFYGLCHNLGIGTPVDNHMAIEHWMKSHELGNMYGTMGIQGAICARMMGG
jgi:hypothetical protein